MLWGIETGIALQRERRDGKTNIVMASAEPLPLPDVLLVPASHDFY